MTGTSPSRWTFESISHELDAVGSGESIWIPKSELPELPSEFATTGLGTPLFIAHPGSVAQYRATPAMHAYELEGGWKIHRDRFDPTQNPVGHFFMDAPELPLAALMAGIAGISTWLVLERDKSEDESSGAPFWRVLASFFVAVVVGVLAYLLFAFIRVGLGVG